MTTTAENQLMYQITIDAYKRLRRMIEQTSNVNQTLRMFYNEHKQDLETDNILFAFKNVFSSNWNTPLSEELLSCNRIINFLTDQHNISYNYRGV